MFIYWDIWATWVQWRTRHLCLSTDSDKLRLRLWFRLIVSLQVCTFIHSSRSSITSASGISVNSASSMDSLDSVLHSSESDAHQSSSGPLAGAGHHSLEVQIHSLPWICISQNEQISSDIAKTAVAPFSLVKGSTCLEVVAPCEANTNYFNSLGTNVTLP